MFKDFINRKFIEWMAESGERRTVTQFADYLDVNQGDLSHWLKGNRTPSGESLDKVAAKLGREAYQIAGKPEPMPDSSLLKRALRAMMQLPPEIQEQIADLAEEKAKEARDKADQENRKSNFNYRYST